MNPHTDSDNERSLPVIGLLNKSTKLHPGTDDELECSGYRSNRVKDGLFIFCVIISLGLILLLLYWKPQLECLLKLRSCPLYKAEYVLLRDIYGHTKLVPVKVLLSDESLGFTACYEGSFSDSSSDTAKLTPASKYHIRYFDYRHIRYVFDQTLHNFKELSDLSTNIRCSSIHEDFHGLSDSEQSQRLMLHGENAIDIEVKSYWRLFIEEVLNPFYIFQIFSVILWMNDQYYYYAGCIVFISCISIGVSLYETRKQSVTLHEMVSSTADTITVARGGQEFEDVSTRCLVPGDVIAIPAHGCIMSCDAVLVAGTCIVNESMLTGESVPVTKTPLTHQEDEEMYSPDVHKRHTLFAGTHVVQTRYYGHARVLAVVVRTGFQTAKGELVRAILFPKPLDFKFYQDAFRFIMFLSFMAAIGMTYTVVNFIKAKVHASKIVLRVLDIVTIIVPPALPAAMTVGTVYAQSRLKKKGIFCISPPRINFTGRINTFCFDKTGTLTEDGLDMWGVVPVRNQCFQDPQREVQDLQQHNPMMICMATCHSLTIIDKELSGDPLDLIMFNSTQWSLEEPGEDTSKYDTIMPTVVRPSHRDAYISNDPQFEVGIIRQFTFSSNMQRMSVITRTLGQDHMEIYCKGAPEKIASLCNPETVPEDFHHVLHKYTIQGLRVIALAYRALDPKVTWHQIQRISRDKVECQLTFLGLLVMQNQLKPQTKPVINRLRNADIRTIMVTGDMIQTAISVARNCGMVKPQDKVVIVKATPPDKNSMAQIEWEYAELPQDDEESDSTSSNGVETDTDAIMESYHAVNLEEEDSTYHFAVSGKAFAVITKYFPELLPKICVKGTIFARMSPEQKCQLIEKLQQLGYIVGMCGDGANDCEALKAAHAGISLSEAEASVAAPFTSQISNIECVVTTMREGRAALVTSFGCFKYMALYSFIQFVSVLILYKNEANLSDFEFLYIDLVITTSIAIFMGYTGAYEKLVAQKPPGSLVKVANLMSIISQVLLVIGFQMAVYFFLLAQAWYAPPPPNPDADNVKSWESTVIFLVSSYMYIAVAVCYSKGPPFRKSMYTNFPFMMTIVLLFSFSTFLLLAPQAPLESFLQMKPLHEKPFLFRVYLFLFALGFIFISSLLEFIVMDTKLLKPLYRCLECGKTKAQHKQVLLELQSLNWPPIGQTTLPSSNGEEGSCDVVINVDTQQAIH